MKNELLNAIRRSGVNIDSFSFARVTSNQQANDLSISEMIDARAGLCPSDPAVVTPKTALTFEQLNGTANRIGRLLRSSGIGADDVVALCLERSAMLVAAMLGVWRAGAAYMPLDPSYPNERLAFMMRDSRPAALLTQTAFAGRLPTGTWREFDLDDEAMISASSAAPLQSEVRPQDLAYVIYTSGSTGQPKGVEIVHRGVQNLVTWHNATFEVSVRDRASHIAGLGFDACIWEVWPYLAAGASLHIPNEQTRMNAAALQSWLIDEEITICFVPTALAEQMITLEWPRESSVRVMLTGGDTLRRNPPGTIPFKLVNNYGPTECTVVTTSGLVPASARCGSPSIGRPISNVEVCILDEQLRPVEPGQVGEIFIGGAGLGRGYRHSPELTAAKFIPHPFAAKSGRKLYRTGDRARFLADGSIGFVGRTDDQIKIRGYRIEPNEIVTVLSAYPGIETSAVIAREQTDEDKYLIAYIVPERRCSITAPGLQQFLREHLPDQMIPRVFVQLEALPLTPSGKVDLSSLPTPDPTNTLQGNEVPRGTSAQEQQVLEILRRLLGVSQVGAADNFFLLGGHSLLAAQLLASIRDAFAVELPLRAVFDHPTASALSSEIEKLQTKVRSATVSEV